MMRIENPTLVHPYYVIRDVESGTALVLICETVPHAEMKINSMYFAIQRELKPKFERRCRICGATISTCCC